MNALPIRVLYIDDDPGLCRLVQRDLERRGYAVETTTDGATGVARIGQGGIDAVALDHTMPNQDGLETLAIIRTLAEPPPVIYVTALQEVQVAVAALKAGATDYVAKDVHGAFLPLLQRAIDAAVDAVGLRRAKNAAEAARQRDLDLTQNIVDTIRDPMVVLEDDMTIVTASAAFLMMFGITEAETRSRPLSALGQNQWDVPGLRRLMEKVLPDNAPIESFEIEDDFPGLGRRVFNLNARKISQSGAYAPRILLVFEDITDRKQRERDAKVLTNEIAHRIKNNLQIVVGLLSHEARATPAPYMQGYKAMQTRIGAIAQLYDLISRSDRGGTIAMDTYLRDIAKILSASLLETTSGITIEVKAEALDIGPNHAVPFGLLVNELATNAIKHAFPGGKGRVVLSVEQRGDQIELTVADDGIGTKVVNLEKTHARGTDYVAIFVRQLGGTISKSDSEEIGTTVRIQLPSLLTPSGGAQPLAA